MLYFQIEEPGFDIDNFDFISDSLELLGADKASAEADAQAMIELNNLLSQASIMILFTCIFFPPNLLLFMPRLIILHFYAPAVSARRGHRAFGLSVLAYGPTYVRL